MSLLYANHVLGQGTVIFNNRVSGTTHVYAPDPYDPGRSIIGQGTNDNNPSGTTSYAGLAPIGAVGINGQYGGWDTWATLFAAPGSNQPESSLQQWTEGGYPQIAHFRTSSASGGVLNSTAVFPNVPADAPVATVQMRVWDALFVYSWDKVLADPTIARGVSPPFNVYNLGGGNNTPAVLFPGLVSFNLFIPAATNPLTLLNPRSDRSNIAFDFLIRLGKTYHVEYKTNLSGAPWTELTSIVGTGLTNFTDSLTSSDARFYRVRIE